MLSVSLFDKDNTGVLSSGEVQRILAKTGEKITQQELLEMVNQADGCLDYKGLLAHCMKLFLSRIYHFFRLVGLMGGSK